MLSLISEENTRNRSSRGFVPARSVDVVGGEQLLKSLAGNPVTITGKIELYKGRPEIVISSPAQIVKDWEIHGQGCGPKAFLVSWKPSLWSLRANTSLKGDTCGLQAQRRGKGAQKARNTEGENESAMTNNKPHQSDTGFIPTANGDGITVKRVELARDSWLFFCVSRRRPGEYFILAGGPHIGGGGKDATPEEAANYLLKPKSALGNIDEAHQGVGWDDVYRYLAVRNKYGFLLMRLPFAAGKLADLA
jgi:hypothetical protein